MELQLLSENVRYIMPKYEFLIDSFDNIDNDILCERIDAHAKHQT